MEESAGLRSFGPRDTIVAVATPPGRGALAIIRLSGPDAFRIASQHVGSWPGSPRVNHLSTVHADATVLDQAMLAVYPAPNSFTGEDTVEFSTHGGQAVPASILAALISSGARQAMPGEFTRRAVLHGKLDLLQAEAVADLIDATSTAMQRAALIQLDGGLSRRLLALREELIGLEALLAYDVDFPEEDDGPIPRVRIAGAVDHVLKSLGALLKTSSTGELVRNGALVVIAGPPNVGKSSLFNALLGKSRAIVTSIPGTTRDALEAVIDGKTWPVRLVDTAGLRETTDEIERLGIEVSEKYLASAQVVLVCAESTGEIERTAEFVAARSNAPQMRVKTKADLVTDRYQPLGGREISVSAETGTGLQDLLGAIDRVLSDTHEPAQIDAPVLTRARHRYCLATASDEIEEFERVWGQMKLPATVASVHLRTAVAQLEELIGTVDVEDVFNRLFSSFCVGK